MKLKEAAKKVLRPVYYRLPANIRYGPQFAPTLRLLDQSERWSRDQLNDYQLTRLRALLKHAARHVPYYKRLFRALGFDPERVREIADLRVLPLLDKETVRANLNDLLADNISPRRMLYFTTGGSTGTPFGVYNLRDAGGRERAFMLKQWQRVGFRAGDRRAMLRGWSVRNRRHWRYEASERAFIFSNFHMTPDNVAEYARVMRAERLLYLHSYPSAVIDFARQLEHLGHEPPRFKVILASSENLYPGQREFIESFYGARLFSWYGHTEDLILAGECEVSHHYHIFPEYGVAEVLKEDGTAAERQGEMGELVGTTIDNYAMPLVRYRTEDWAVIGPPQCECGRSYKLLEATRGRWHQEMLVGRLGNLISITALNVHSDVFDRVQQVQFYQRERGKVELRIRRRDGYGERDSRRILAALAEKIGDTMEVELKFTDAIPLVASGKFRFLIQELPVPRPALDEARFGSSL
ncbi:MAG TPA: phenylacetate--CoA ligase family protein [Blastocatellia bacterium]|nr:phenylacetate--CoA ligase family protein [Blastocatellia bacterium]